MKKMMIGIVGLVAVVASVASAASFRALSVEEMAAMGATHVAKYEYSDFAACTTTNTALTLTNSVAIAAKDAVECVGLVLEKAFDTGNTNYTGSVLLTVGDSSDADLFMTSTELASDGTEVWFKFGREDVETITSTVTKHTVSLTDTNGVTALSMTNATVASTAAAGVTARKVYTAANNIIFTFTPNAEEALSANTVGSVKVYFRILKGGK